MGPTEIHHYENKDVSFNPFDHLKKKFKELFMKNKDYHPYEHQGTNGFDTF